MKPLLILVFCVLVLAGCEQKKPAAATTATPALNPEVVLTQTIERAIVAYDNRLDIKMKRKFYEPRKGDLITIQKWFEFGDTNRLIKLREEILTGDQKMEVIQYHFIENKLAEIHEYQLDKKCENGSKQCMTEAKYFFDKGDYKSAVSRQKQGTAQNPPVIESAAFQPLVPAQAYIQAKMNKLEALNKKYAILPFPKPKPENRR